MGRKKAKTTNQPPKRKARSGTGPRRRPPSSEPFSMQSAGASLGKFVGSAAGSLLGKVFGMGAYTVEQNALLSPSGTIGPPPMFTTSPDGSVIVCMREFVTTISGSTNFTMQFSQPINPSNPSLFPRLSQLAPNFTVHEPLGLIFEYVTTSGTAVGSTNTALGTIIMATNYDVLENQFSTKQEMESYKFSTATVPCASVLHAIECKPSTLVGSRRYIGDPATYGSTNVLATVHGDRRLADLGLFQVASVGQQGTNIQGEIWVSYCWKLGDGRQNPYATTAHIYTSGASSAAAPLSGGLVSHGSTLATVITNTTFTLPVTGRFIVLLDVIGSTITSTPTFTVGANITGVNGLVNYGNSSVSSFTASNANEVFCCTVTAPGVGAANTITIGGMATMVSGTLDILILRAPEFLNGGF